MKKSYLIGLLLILVGIASVQYWQVQKQAPVQAGKKGKACADFGSPAKRKECKTLTGNKTGIVYQNGEYFDSALLPQYRTMELGDCSQVAANANVYYKKGFEDVPGGGVQNHDPMPEGTGFRGGKIVGSFCGIVQVDDGSGHWCSKKDFSGCSREETIASNEASPSPSPSPSVSPSPSPSPSVTPSPSVQPDHATLVIRKFKDDDHDGFWDTNEGKTGIEWKFQFRISSDPWQDYTVPADRDFGGNVDISLGTKVEVREIEQAGWTNSTGLSKIEILSDPRTYFFDFGNFQAPGVTVTTAPSVAPQAGSTSHFWPLVVLAGVGLALQLTAFLL